MKTPAIYDYFTKTFTYTTVTRSVEVAVCGGETIAPTDATVFRTQH